MSNESVILSAVDVNAELAKLAGLVCRLNAAEGLSPAALGYLQTIAGDAAASVTQDSEPTS